MKRQEGRVIPIGSGRGRPYDAAKEKENNIVGMKIAEARKKKGMSIAAFSRYLDHFGVNISTGGAGKWETGYSIPNAYQLIAICSALEIDDAVSYFTQNYTPLLNSEGQRKVEEYRADLAQIEKYRPAPKGTGSIRRIEMPVYEMPASAGTGNFLEDSPCEMVSIPENTVPRGADFGVRISGDSMEPAYHDGQIVWVRKTEQVNVGEVGIFIYDGASYIKMYGEQEPPEDIAEEYTDSYGTVHMQPVLISLNDNYPDRPVAPGCHFMTVGKVL